MVVTERKEFSNANAIFKRFEFTACLTDDDKKNVKGGGEGKCL